MGQFLACFISARKWRNATFGTQKKKKKDKKSVRVTSFSCYRNTEPDKDPKFRASTLHDTAFLPKCSAY